MQSNSNILQVKNLSKSFGGLKAISNCSLKIKKGSMQLVNEKLLDKILKYLKNPLIIFYSIIWYFKGKPYLKKRLFDASNFQVKNLPFNESVIKIIKDAKLQNKKIYLFTGSTQKIADEVSNFLNLF